MSTSTELSDEQRAQLRREYIRERDVLKSNLDRLSNYLDKAGIHVDFENLKTRVHKIKTLYSRFPLIQKSLKKLEPDVDHESIEEHIEDEYEIAMAYIRKLQTPTPMEIQGLNNIVNN